MRLPITALAKALLASIMPASTSVQTGADDRNSHARKAEPEAKAFISFSRNDMDFADQLDAAPRRSC
jgi:hypothetical protein